MSQTNGENGEHETSLVEFSDTSQTVIERGLEELRLEEKPSDDKCNGVDEFAEPEEAHMWTRKEKQLSKLDMEKLLQFECQHTLMVEVCTGNLQLIRMILVLDCFLNGLILKTLKSLYIFLIARKKRRNISQMKIILKMREMLRVVDAAFLLTVALLLVALFQFIEEIVMKKFMQVLTRTPDRVYIN